MKKHVILFILTWLCFLPVVNSQPLERCGVEYLPQLLERDPLVAKMHHEAMQEWENKRSGSLFKTDTTYDLVTVPVVVHVVWNTTSENITDQKITDNLAQLNKDFRAVNTDTATVPAAFKPLIADARIQFCLATTDPNGQPTTGILRKQTSKTSFVDYFTDTSDPVKFDSLGGENAWPTDKYLNIWICDISGGTGGYATNTSNSPPLKDGVVIDYGRVSSTSRTMTHETGHWFGLWHIWGPGSDCGSDDLVSDTPLQAGPTNNICPSFPRLDSCTSSGNGVMFMNYMDYSTCGKMFSKGQVDLMRNELDKARRTSLRTSVGCQVTSIEEINMTNIFQVFPNPSNGILTIKAAKPLGHATIELYNALGQIVHAEKINTSSSENLLNLSALTPGIYFIRIHADSGEKAQRIIIQ